MVTVRRALEGVTRGGVGWVVSTRRGEVVKAGLVLSIRSLVVGLVLAACQPSTASVTIHHPGEREMVYGYLDVSVRAVVADPRSVKVWVDDGEWTRGPWLRIEHRARSTRGCMWSSPVRAGTGDRIDFTVSHAVPCPIRRTVNVLWRLAHQLRSIGGVGTDTNARARPGSACPPTPGSCPWLGVVARDFLGIASAEAARRSCRGGRGCPGGMNDAMKGRLGPAADSRAFQKLIGIPSPETSVSHWVLPGYGSRRSALDSVKDDIDVVRPTLRTIVDRGAGAGRPSTPGNRRSTPTRRSCDRRTRSTSTTRTDSGPSLPPGRLGPERTRRAVESLSRVGRRARRRRSADRVAPGRAVTPGCRRGRSAAGAPPSERRAAPRAAEHAAQELVAVHQLVLGHHPDVQGDDDEEREVGGDCVPTRSSSSASTSQSPDSGMANIRT